jgi:HPt (histidine-containing phosphotransfer) domain-containing protein
MSDTPAFHLPSLLDRCGGDAALAREIVALFCVQSRRLIEELRHAADAGQFHTARRIAHQLNGSAANLSAERVRRLASDMEALFNSGQPREAGALLGPLSAELERCYAAESSLATDLAERGNGTAR